MPERPPTQLQFAQYYFIFTFIDHTKHTKNQIGPLGCHLMSFDPSYNYGQGPPLHIRSVQKYMDFFSCIHPFDEAEIVPLNVMNVRTGHVISLDYEAKHSSKIPFNSTYN